jgi:hypothetical protein
MEHMKNQVKGPTAKTGPFIAIPHPLLRDFCVQKEFIVVWFGLP